LLTKPGLAQKLGEKGRERIEKELNRKRMAQRIRKVIHGYKERE